MLRGVGLEGEWAEAQQAELPRSRAEEGFDWSVSIDGGKLRCARGVCARVELGSGERLRTKEPQDPAWPGRCGLNLSLAGALRSGAVLGDGKVPPFPTDPEGKMT